MRHLAKALPALIISVVLGAAAPAALGQPVAPSAKPKAAEGPKDKTKGDKPAASAAPAASAGLPAGSAGLPAGHPPVDQGLPAGHPPVGGDDESDDEMPPPPSPHGGGQPRQAPPGVFQPPADAAQDDAGIPVGSIQIHIKDAQGRPIPRARLTLEIIHSSVAKGDSSSSRPAETDGDGQVRFDNMETGSEVRYRITTARGPATYAIAPFQLSDRVGKRALLHSYDVTSDIDSIELRTVVFIQLSLREDSIQVLQSVIVGDLSPVSWVADAPFALPEGFKAFNKREGSSEARVDEVNGKGAALRGTFSPGRHDIEFNYQVPLTKDPTQVLKLEVPPNMIALTVGAELGRGMGVKVTGSGSRSQVLPDAQPRRSEKKRFLVTEWQMRRADDNLSKLEITLTGLPSEGPGRWIAITTAVAVFLAGLVYALQGKRDDLLETRKALLSRILTFSSGKSDDVSPLPAFSRLRVVLLAFIMIGLVFALGFITICIGLASVLPKRDDVGVMDPDARDDLIEAREALLAEIVALERAHKKGDVGPKYYARARAALLDALARIVDMLDAGRAEKKKRRRAARAAEPSP